MHSLDYSAVVGAEGSHVENRFFSCGNLSPDGKQNIPLSSVLALSLRDI